MIYRDSRGYEREDHSDLVHRNRAYHIYLQNRNRYPLPWGAYEVHHIDFDKNNNKVSNLAIVTPTEHDRLHEERKIQQEKELRRKAIEEQKKREEMYKKQVEFSKRTREQREKETEERVNELLRHEKEMKGNENKKKSRVWNWLGFGFDDKEEEKPYKCLDCGRPIRHEGRCLPCNTRRKNEKKYSDIDLPDLIIK